MAAISDIWRERRLWHGLVVAVAGCCLAGCHPFPGDWSGDGLDIRFGRLPAATPADPIAGESFAIGFNVRNEGSWDAGQVNWRVTEGTTLIASGHTRWLEWDSSQDVVVYVVAAAGGHSYTVALDPDDDIDEDNESNNNYTLAVAVAPSADG